MKPRPLISIITVCYNAEATISATLQSIDNQIGVDPEVDFRHIVIDGASSDATLDILKSYQQPYRTVYSEPDRGIYDAMNKGMDHADGEYYIFLNAGDAFHASDTLNKIVETIRKNDRPGIVYGQTDLVDTDRNFIGHRHLSAPEHLTYDSFKQGMVVCHQAFVALARIAPRYDLHYRYSADYDWCLQCLQHSRHNRYIPDVLIDYLSEGVTTANRYASLRERFRIMCFYFGATSTVIRHLKFVPRFIKNKINK